MKSALRMPLMGLIVWGCCAGVDQCASGNYRVLGMLGLQIFMGVMLDMLVTLHREARA